MDMWHIREQSDVSSDPLREQWRDISQLQRSGEEPDLPVDVPAGHPFGDTDAIDPFTDEHDIEYWIWDGFALVPASPLESERFREREALFRLVHWQRKERPIAVTTTHTTLRHELATLGQAMLTRLRETIGV